MTLPKDCRTLYQTPRAPATLRVVEPGKYLHIGFESSLKQILSNNSSALLPPVLKVDIHADGAQASKSGGDSFWPLQIRTSNLEQCDPEVITDNPQEETSKKIRKPIENQYNYIKQIQFIIL